MTDKLETAPEPVYSCSALLNQVEQDLGNAENAPEFFALQARQSALLSLLNCGIEYTTLSKLNKIAKTDT